MATAALPPSSEAPSGPIYIDTQHDDMVHDAQMDYYGCKLATSSSDRTVKIYNVSGSNYEHAATLTGHEGPVWQVSWAHPKFGVILASCSFDGSILIHAEVRPGEWTNLYKEKLHESSVNGIAFAPHECGLMLATASSDGKVAVLTHQPDHSWTAEYLQDNVLGVNSVSWAPYGAYYDTDSPDTVEPPRLVTGGCDNQVRFWIRSGEGWQLDSAAPISKALSHTDWVRDVAWAPPILPKKNVVASCSEDKTVLIWTQDGDKESEWTPTLLSQFEAPVWRVSWSLTGQMLAVSSGDNDVTLWKQELDGVWSKMDTVEDNAATTTASAPQM